MVLHMHNLPLTVYQTNRWEWQKQNYDEADVQMAVAWLQKKILEACCQYCTRVRSDWDDHEIYLLSF